MKTKNLYFLAFFIMFVLSMPGMNVIAQQNESGKTSPKTLSLRPNSRDKAPTRRDNLNQRMIHKHKQNAVVNPDNQKKFKDKEIKPNKKAIHNRKLNKAKVHVPRKRIIRK